jgi:Proteasome subunit
MAASFPGGVVLGADTRTSTGSYVANRVTNKLTQLADKVLACCQCFTVWPPVIAGAMHTVNACCSRLYILLGC